MPTLEIGQRVLVNRIGARFSDPSVGDIVVFHPPAGAEPDNTCGGGPPPDGQVCDKPTAEQRRRQLHQARGGRPGRQDPIRDGHVVLNGKRQKEPFARAVRRRRGVRLPDARSRFPPITTS